MANALIIQVTETLQELKGVLKKSSLHLSPRIKMLIEIKNCKEAMSKNKLAEKVGVNHNSIQTWREKYQQGGLSDFFIFITFICLKANKHKAFRPFCHSFCPLTQIK